MLISAAVAPTAFSGEIRIRACMRLPAAGLLGLACHHTATARVACGFVSRQACSPPGAPERRRPRAAARARQDLPGVSQRALSRPGAGHNSRRLQGEATGSPQPSSRPRLPSGSAAMSFKVMLVYNLR